MSKEIVALSLLSLCKLYFYNQLIDSIKKSIKKGRVLMVEEKGRFLITDDIPITYIDET